jgi:hypothetical protein
MIGAERVAAAAAESYFFIHNLLIRLTRNNTAKSVPLASCNRVNIIYEINIG